MRREACLFISAVILLSGPALAGVAPTEAAILQEGARMHYHAVVSYSSTDARTERQLADADGSGSVDEAEGLSYEGYQAALRLGNASSSIRWDGNGATWADISVKTEKFSHRNFNSAFSLIIDGTLRLDPASGPNHTLIVSNLTGFSNYSFSLSLPQNWSITGVAGVFVTSVSPTAVFGYVDPGSLALIRVTESPEILPPDVEGMNLAWLAEIAKLNASLLEELARTNTTLFGALAAHDAGLLAVMAGQNATLLASMAAQDGALAGLIAQTNASLLASLAAQDERLTANLASQNISLLASLAAQNRSLMEAIAASNASLLQELARANASLHEQLMASNGQLWSALNESGAKQASALAATQSELQETNASLARARVDVSNANSIALLGAALGATGVAVAIGAVLIARRAVNRIAERAGLERGPQFAPEDSFSPFASAPSRGHSMAAEGEIGNAGDTDP